MVSAALGAACGSDAQTRNECTDGELRECYGGPAGTENIGPCRTGLEICSGARWPGICVGDIVPLVESCNDFDDNCNGIVDDAPTVGDACLGTNDCTGVLDCDAGGRVRCFAPSKNDCGLCDGPDIDNLGDDCVSDEGCLGGFVCAGDLTIAVCTTPVQNECDVCGGPAVTGLGVDCMSADSCAGTTVCNATGDAAMCNAPMKNECDVCAPSIGTLGGTCSGDHGCLGAIGCNATGDAPLCTLDANCPHLVISEVTTGVTGCVSDEYIELYNPSSRAVSLAGYSLRYRSGASTTYQKLVAFADDAMIASHGYYLIASARGTAGCVGSYTTNPANTVAADATFVAVQMSATEASLWLTTADADPTDITDVIVVDVVGYGTPNAAEGTPVDEPVIDGAIERKASATSTSASLAAGGAEVTAGNGYDSGDNAADFVQQATRTPQNTSSTVEP
jgi:Lamin Tail Domain